VVKVAHVDVLNKCSKGKGDLCANDDPPSVLHVGDDFVTIVRLRLLATRPIRLSKKWQFDRHSVHWRFQRVG
jgi:hypothetical protein